MPLPPGPAVALAHARGNSTPSLSDPAPTSAQPFLWMVRLSPPLHCLAHFLQRWRDWGWAAGSWRRPSHARLAGRRSCVCCESSRKTRIPGHLRAVRPSVHTLLPALRLRARCSTSWLPPATEHHTDPSHSAASIQYHDIIGAAATRGMKGRESIAACRGGCLPQAGACTYRDAIGDPAEVIRGQVHARRCAPIVLCVACQGAAQWIRGAAVYAWESGTGYMIWGLGSGESDTGYGMVWYGMGYRVWVCE